MCKSKFIRADNMRIVNLERRSFELPVADGVTAADLEKTAVTNAMTEAFALTFETYGLGN